MMKYTFNRQKPLNRYIVDFYCKPLNLVIEIDGAYHFETEQKVKDNIRQKFLEEMPARPDGQGIELFTFLRTTSKKRHGYSFKKNRKLYY